MVCQGAGLTGRNVARCAHTLLCTHTNPAALVTGKTFWEQLARHCSGKTMSQRSCWPSWQTSALPHADSACDKPLQEPFHSNPGSTSAKEVFRTSLSRKSQQLQSWRTSISFRKVLPIKHHFDAHNTVMGTGCNAQLPGCDRATSLYLRGAPFLKAGEQPVPVTTSRRSL